MKITQILESKTISKVPATTPRNFVAKNAKTGGAYIGEKQLHLPLKFGTSLYNCKNRDERQKLLRQNKLQEL